jgi:hypothetical protein
MPGELRALTIRPPWSHAIAYWGKDVENRTWSTHYQGDLAIHAGKSFDDEALEDWRIVNAITRIGYQGDGLTPGRVIAVARLYDCHPIPDETGLSGCGTPARDDRTCSLWADETGHHWRLRNVRPLADPVPCKGMLGLWRLPEDAEKAVRAQLEEK